ncbi:hypothetical protein D3C73_1224030 [compost metagenome]
MLFWLLDALHHFRQNEHASFSSLFKRVSQNLTINSVNFNIHLDRCHTFGGSGNFKVHIAKMILHTLNVRQNGYMFSIFNQTHSNTGNRRFDRYTRIHHRQRSGTNTCLRS